MGRATRWLKGLFGIKTTDRERNDYSCEGTQNGRWSSVNSGRNATGLCHNPATIPPNITPAEAAWLRSFYSGDSTDKEQNRHAIAVAAATAAAADAAVAAAQAAVAVVRLTSQGRGAAMFGGSREKWAAVKIQNVFRGYLARKALRALKGLVRIQALVRGFLVRKQAAATLHSMQALIRAQATVRAWRRPIYNEESFPPQFQAPVSVEKCSDERSEHPASLHSTRLSSSFDAHISPFDESPKTVEVDTGCRPKSRSRRANSWMPPPISGEDSFGKAFSTPIAHCRIPAPNYPEQDWGLTGEECHFSTAQSTPRFATTSCGCSNGGGPVTPARSVCTEGYFRNCGGESPNYMAKTQSFKSKVRSQSAPKQRPEPGPKKRLSLNEMMESRSSLSGVRMKRSCSQAQETISFKNAVMGKLGRSSDFVRENNVHPN